MMTFLRVVTSFFGPATEEKTAPPIAAWKSQGTALIVDDDADHVEAVKQILIREGLQVMTATSAVKALSLLAYAPKNFNLVLLDYSMPDYDGLHALEHIRKLNSRIKVIGLTGAHLGQLPRKYVCGVDHLMQKPYRASELLDAIETLLTLPGTPRPATAAA